MSKNIVRLVSGIILASIVFMGCSNKKIDTTYEYIANEDIEYIKSVNELDKSDEKIYTLFYGKVTEDNDNLSVLETVFADEYNYENGYQPGACFIDTEDNVELSLGDFVVLEIEQDLNSSDWTGFVLIKGPMSEDEFKKYVEEEIKRKEEMEEKMGLEEEVEELEEDVEEFNEEDNKIVGGMIGDNRKKEETKDPDAYLITSTNRAIFIPTMSQKEYKSIYDTVRTNKRVESQEDLGNILGEYQATVVLSAPGKVVLAVNREGVYKYYALRVMNDYRLGDELTIIEGDEGVQSFFIVGD